MAFLPVLAYLFLKILHSHIHHKSHFPKHTIHYPHTAPVYETLPPQLLQLFSPSKPKSPPTMGFQYLHYGRVRTDLCYMLDHPRPKYIRGLLSLELLSGSRRSRWKLLFG